MDIWKHIKNVGIEAHPENKDAVRGVFVFVCPYCGGQLSSASFLNVGYFQVACGTHVNSMACAMAQGKKELSVSSVAAEDELPF